MQVVHQKEGQDDDVVTLVERQPQGLTEHEQDQDETDGKDRESDVEEIVLPALPFLRDPVDERIGNFAFLMSDPVNVIRQTQVLE